MSAAAPEVEQLLTGAAACLENADFLANAPGAPASAVFKAYDLAVDAINGVSRAYWRHAGRHFDPRTDSQSRIMREIVRTARRAGLRGVPDEDDLHTMIEARNGSVHQGLASATSIEQAQVAIRIAGEYTAVVRRMIATPH
jgi:hypothetical protein